MSDATCKKEVWSGWHRYPCERRATKDDYCWQHHPDAVKAREEKSRQKTQEEWNRSPAHQLILARERIAELEAALAERDKALRSACRKWAMCCDSLVVCRPCIRNAGEGYRLVLRSARAEEGGGT